MSKTWTVEIDADGVLPLPDDLLEAAGIDVGDELEWIDNGDGTWTMQRVEPAAAPRTRVDPRPEPATMELTVSQIRDLYGVLQYLSHDTVVRFHVDRSNGIGPVTRARWSAEMDLTDVESW